MSRSGILKNTARIALALVLCWLILRAVPFREATSRLASASIPLLLLSLSTNLVSMYIQAIRWKVLLIGKGPSTVEALPLEPRGRRRELRSALFGFRRCREGPPDGQGGRRSRPLRHDHGPGAIPRRLRHPHRVRRGVPPVARCPHRRLDREAPVGDRALRLPRGRDDRRPPYRP